MTLPEVLLWQQLRGRSAAPVFRRQHPLGPYILDFFCPAARLAIEVDGEGHACMEAAEHDARRTAWLEARGVSVVRLSARDVLKDPVMQGDGLRSLARERMRTSPVG